jgi:hypothetical protein
LHANRRWPKRLAVDCVKIRSHERTKAAVDRSLIDRYRELAAHQTSLSKMQVTIDESPGQSSRFSRLVPRRGLADALAFDRAARRSSGKAMAGRESSWICVKEALVLEYAIIRNDGFTAL